MNWLYHQLFVIGHDDLTNPHRSQTIDISEDDNVKIEDSQGITKTRSKNGKGHINTVYEDQSINGNVMPIDSSKLQRRSSRARKL